MTFEVRDDGAVAVAGLPTGCGHCRQCTADSVDETEKRRRNSGVEHEVAGAQRAEEVFARVGQLLQVTEAQKPTGALDRVHRAEDSGQQIRIVRVRLQLDQVQVQLVEILGALLQEGLDELIVLIHVG